MSEILGREVPDGNLPRWEESAKPSRGVLAQAGFSYPPYFLLYQFSSLQYYRLMLCGTLYLPRQGRGQQQHSKRRWHSIVPFQFSKPEHQARHTSFQLSMARKQHQSRLQTFTSSDTPHRLRSRWGTLMHTD